jgi:hypothetical protein
LGLVKQGDQLIADHKGNKMAYDKRSTGDKAKQSMPGIGRGNHPNTLAALTSITNPDVAREYQKRSTESRKMNLEKIYEFRAKAKLMKSYMKDLPGTSALDVLRMAMHIALDKEDFDEAARYAGMLAEYEMPKLARIESTVTNRIEDMSDEDLKKIARAEGLSLETSQASDPEDDLPQETPEDQLD